MNDATTTQTLPASDDATANRAVGSSEMLVPTKTALEHFADRRASLLVIRALAIGFVVFVVGMLLLAVADQFIRLSTGLRTVASLFVDAMAMGAAWVFGIRESRTRDWTAIAQRMESATPALRERMLSAVELGTDQSVSSSSITNGSVEFRRELQNQVADQVSKLEVARMLPWGLVRKWTLIAALIALAIAVMSLVPSWQIPRRLARVMIPMAPIERASMTKIEIVRPTPPTRSVAEGDLVAVAVSISQLGRGSVYLESRSDEGVQESLVMSPRDLTPLSGMDLASASANPEDGDREKDLKTESFAVNVQVQQTPIHYRVIAGDGETLWHTLTPQPRPKMVSFEKRYQFPSYSKLPELITNDEFGDLVGVVGTQAEVTVTFDQPVHQVELLFGGGRNDTRIPVSPLNESSTRFRYRIPIKTPGSYRVDAVSKASELNNPFSPRFSIDPILDQPPTAIWSGEIPDRQIVSSAAVIDLSGKVEDDMPMDLWIQQVVLDNGKVIDRPVSIASKNQPGDPSTQSGLIDTEMDFRTRSMVSLKWDMMNYTGRGDSSLLPPGSQLKTRLIALDRAGNRGASDWIHVFIAGDEFDASRHDELRDVQQLSRRVRNWFDDFGKLNDELLEVAKQSRKNSADNLKFKPDWTKSLQSLRNRWSEIAGWSDANSRNDEDPDQPVTMQNQVSRTNDSVEADRWTLLDRYVGISLDQTQDGLSNWLLFEQQKLELEQRDQESLVNHGIEMINRSAKTPTQIAELSQWILSIELAAGLMRDLEIIRGDAELLSRTDANVPIERLPGQADLLVERLREVGDLAESMQVDLPNNTVRHQERLHRYLSESMSRIERENEKLQLDRNPDAVTNFQNEMGRIAEELRYHRTTSLLQGDTFNQIIAAVRDLNRTHLHNYRGIEILRDAARDLERASEQVQRAREEDDTEAMQSAAANEEVVRQRFETWRRLAKRLFDQAEMSERSRTDMSVQAASDWKLVGAVVETVTDEEFVLPEPLNTPENQSSERILDGIRKAATVLESGNQAVRLTNQLQDLSDRERYGENLADSAVRQGARLEHYQAASETPFQLLREAGVENELMEDLQATRWDQDFQQARQWTTSRRYDSGPFVSASAPVQLLVNRVRDGLPAISETMADARRKLRAFLPTTGELARKAAKKAQEAPQAEESRDEKEDAAEVKEKEQSDSNESMESLQEKVDALAENLADRANTASYDDEAERELAKDADAAIAKINEQMKAVAEADEAVNAAKQESDESPDASDELAATKVETLKELAETLETTAEHFDAADQGESVESTREALREGVPDSEMQAAADSAEATNRAANASPEELLERLEDRLDADAAMQKELAEISKQTAAAAEQAVRSAAKQEKNIRQELERVDAEFAEKKREIRDQLKSLSDQARSVNDHWLSMTESVSGWDKDQESRDAIRQSREELTQAIDRAEQVQNDQALLNELEDASDQLRSAVKQVADQAEQVQKQASKRADDEVHESEKSRQKKARELEQAELQAKNRWLKSLADQAKDWKRRRDEAGRRAQTAQNQERNAERQLQQAKQQLDKHPDEEWAQKGFQESEQRVEQAKQAGEQAKQTRQAAEQAEKEAANRLAEQRRDSVKDLTENNPTAELLARMAEKSNRELSRIAESLKPMTDQSELAESLSPSQTDMKRLADQQSHTSQTVEQAAGDLERAARHEERLGNKLASDELSKAAEQLKATLNDSMQQAEQSLAEAAQASETARLAQQAGQQLSKAAEQLAAQADQLADLQKAFASQESEPSTAAQDQASDDRNGAAPADPSPMKEMSTGTLAEANRSEKLARTLDELDRGINQPDASKQQPANQESAEESQQASQQQADGSQQGQPGEDGQSQGSKPTAGETSPTLAASAQQAIRELAAQRQQQVQQIASASQPNDAGEGGEGESSSQSDSQSQGESGEPTPGQDGKPGTVSGDGSEMPGGGVLDIAGQGRVDEEWGMLREQKNADVIQDRKARLPMSYRPAIEAYFQAISAEAARAEKSLQD